MKLVSIAFLMVCCVGFTEGSGPAPLSCEAGRFLFKHQCVLCHPTCSACDGHELFECTTCGVDEDGHERFLHQGRCRLHCPRGFFSDRGRRVCLPCIADCELCADGTVCAKCREHYKLLNGVCQTASCELGQVEDPDTGECLDCEVGCNTCSTDDPGVCSSCIESHFFFRHQCRRHCPQGTYEDPGRRLCQACPIPCTDCRSDAHCLACQTGYFTNDGECVKQCPRQTFADTNGWRCQSCHSSCQTCHGPRSTHCDSCVGENSSVHGQCPLVTCPEGQYSNGKSGQCHSCDTSCKTCFGPQALDCSSCFTGHLLDQESSCVEHCPLGSYANTSTQLCEACSPNCEACLGSRDVCTSCSTSSYIFLHQGRCWSNCPEGFFETTEGSCQACDDSCLTCDGTQTQCLSCGEGRFLESGTCRLNCSLRTYPAEDGTCRRCPPHCDVCLDERTCFRCSFLYLILNGACKASCPTGYYDDMEEDRCGTCHPTCSTCFGPLADDCETCSDATPKLYDGGCSKDCPPGTYYETAAMECQECHQTCAGCSGPEANQCTQCERGLVLDPNTLLCGVTGDTACPPRTYLHDDQFTCMACHRQCLSCGGPGQDQCQTCAEPKFLYTPNWMQTELRYGFVHHVTTCPSGYYRQGSSCEECDRSCEQCTGPGPESCQACSAPLLELQGTRLCVERCPRRFYERHGVCLRCHVSCQTCTDAAPQSCETCDWGNTFKDNVCYPRCGEGHYYAQEASRPTDICKPCHRSCRHCSGPGPAHCLSCLPEFGLHAGESRCAPCCQTRQNDTDCCVCDTRTALCTEAPPPKPGDLVRTADGELDAGEGEGHASAALPTALLLALGSALAVFALVKARAKKRLCWRRSYERLSGSASGAMPHGVPEPDSGDEADVVYTAKGGAVYRRYSFYQDQDGTAQHG
ncbi:hypothetical protein NHX12_002364 [Muraenolepis orangiensis]|uniref:TNFR-Cys domain-containing protein n=1 Tax=Muraenolepis orangiensis TaxID=630683 RepID=A0A9Q0DZC7_9TELE|nr:hypothetical protein NHX12_002364 [Muraenolepis orangiensis]